MKFILTNLLLLALSTTWGQTKLVINNGGILTLQGGVNLLIENPAHTAITLMGADTGYIVSEDQNNLVIWSVGGGDGSPYFIPFGTPSAFMPISFTPSGGSADGHFLFSTNPTSSWKNSDELPLGVTNVLAGTSDNSAKLVDRFWQIRPIGYTTKPSLDNIVFSYTAADLAAPNTITEVNLIAQRWNDVSKSWGDYFPPSVVNTSAHTVTVTHIPGNQLYSWWTLVDGSVPLPVTLLHFQAEARSSQVLTSWQTASEFNSSRFEVWRSKDGTAFDPAGSVAAAGDIRAIHRRECRARLRAAAHGCSRQSERARRAGATWNPSLLPRQPCAAMLIARGSVDLTKAARGNERSERADLRYAQACPQARSRRLLSRAGSRCIGGARRNSRRGPRSSH